MENAGNDAVDYRALFRAQNQRRLILDRKLRIIEATDAYLRFLGCPRQDFLGQEWQAPPIASLYQGRGLDLSLILAHAQHSLDNPFGSPEPFRPIETTGGVCFTSSFSQFGQHYLHTLEQTTSTGIASESPQAPQKSETPANGDSDHAPPWDDLIDALPARVTVMNTEGKFLRFNHAASSGSALQSSQFIGMFAGDIPSLKNNPKSREQLVRGVRQAASGIPFREEINFTLKDGKPRLFDLSIHPVHDQAGKISWLVSCGIEVQRRVEAEQRYRESELQFRELADNLPDAVWIRDLASDNILYVSPAYERVFDRSCSELYRDSFSYLDTVHPDDYGPLSETLAANRALTPLSLTFRVIAQNCVQRWVWVRTHPIRDEEGIARRLVGVARDITDLKETEHRLQASEYVYRQLFEDNPQSLWIYDRQSLDILEVNNAATLHYGYSREEFLQLTVLDLNEPEMHSLLLDLLPRREGPVHRAGIWPQRTKDGTPIETEITTHDIDFDGTPARLVLAVDVTERVRAEKALHQSQRQLYEVLEIARIGYWEYDPSQQLVTWSRELSKIAELEVPVYRESFRDFCLRIHPEDRVDYVQAIQTRLDRKLPIDHVYRIGTGEQFCVLHERGNVTLNEEGNVARLFGSAQDITEQWIAERSLRESEWRFRTVAQVITDAIWDWDIQSNELWWSDGFFTLFGYSQDEVESSIESWYNRLHPDDKDVAVESVHEVLRSQNNYWQSEFRFLRKNGTYAIVLDRGIVLRDATGTAIRMFGGMTDVSTQREAEEAIHRLNQDLEERVQHRTAELEATNKELEAFSYSVSHDLRAPLRAVDGFARILIEEHRDRLNEEAQEFLDLIRGNARQMGQLIDDLLEFSRLSRQNMRVTEVDVELLIRQCLDELKSDTASRNIEFVIESLPPVTADRSLLKQVCINLLANAVKYTRKREKALVIIGYSPQEPQGPAYFVKDNGVGFDMRYYNKLFGVFQRLHRAEDYPGTGVGLAIVQRVVYRHGGSVWAEAVPDGGATFYFSLGKGDRVCSKTGSKSC